MRNLPEIIFEDDYLIAINKDAGVLSIPDRFNPDIPNLVSWLKERFPELIPVHRLDKFTSGVNVFAKDPETHRRISAQFESRETEKYYIAIVDGIPNPESGIIDQPLAESQAVRGKMLIHRRGKESITQYQVAETFGRYSLLDVRIFTGRMHQIRVHLQHIGHPLVVDSLYGKRDVFFLSEIKNKKFKLGKDEEEKPLLSRQPLHASKLIITHPFDPGLVTIEATPPKDITAVLNQLRKWTSKARENF
ncbi:MAG: RluA family pseudouridine synthase [Saprospiraceae bacterium]|nr:RluA family pseudouridine synthase [Saprospiraceae bacterium]